MSVKLTQEMIDGAIDSQKKYGIPASITLGQILLESGGSYEGGLSGLAYNHKNLFGIKGIGTNGSANMLTTEYYNGKPTKIYDNFRKYHNFKESIEDHSKLLMKSWYTKHTKNAKTVEEYARGIHKGGYATSPTYANQLIDIINRNDLKKYDSGDFKPSSDVNDVTNDINNDVNDVVTGDKNLTLFGKIVKFIIYLLVLALAIFLFYKSF